MTIEERRFEHYTEWLLKAGANPEIVAMPAIQELIKQLISMGDPCVVFEGRSPISYEMPREDGTFDIAARTNGPCVTIRYIMSYCDENNPNNLAFPLSFCFHFCYNNMA